MTEKLVGIHQNLAEHDKGLLLLHEGQMHLEKNLKMLMMKMGVTPTNTLPPEERDASMSEGVHEDEDEDKGKQAGLEKNPSFALTANEFDKVMEDCSRARPDALQPPPKKKEKKNVSSPSDVTEGGDMEL